jgi:hypothetical protein
MVRFCSALLRASLVLIALIAQSSLFDVRAATPVPAPVGLDVDGTSYALISNTIWTVTDAAGAQTRAKNVSVIAPRNPSGTSAYDRQAKAYVWAQVCSSARQMLTFRRTLFMPGRPKTFGAQFDPTFYGSIGVVTVFINGKQALAFANGYIRIAEAASPTVKFFKFGINDIEVRVTKRAKSTSQGFCNSGNPPKPLGLYFNLYGKYETNVAVSPVATGLGGNDHRYAKAVAEARIGIVTINDRYRSMLNLGPSGLYRGTLIINLNAGPSSTGLEVGDVSIRGTQIRNCKQKSLHERHWQIACDVERWAAGTKPGITFTAHVGLPTTPEAQKTVDLYGDAHLYAKTSDPDLSKNDDNFQVTICKPGATNANCPT